MLKRLFAFIFGQVWFELEGGLTERFLNYCADKNIILKNIRVTASGLMACVPYRGFAVVQKAAKLNRCTLKINKKTGLCFILAPYKHRYGIAAGLIIFCLLLALSKNIVWDIRFFECSALQEAQLRHSLYEKGVYEGAVVSRPMLERVRKEIIIENTAFGWVTLNYIKGRIVVEKTDATPKPEFFSKDITNVVATHDGIVREIDVSGGFVRVCEGQSVAKGDVLVSGTYVDASGNTQKVHAQGKIYADIEKTYELTQKLSYAKQLPTGKRKSYYELKLLNSSIKLFKSLPLLPESEQRLYRYPLVLFGFHFPATVYEYEVREQTQQNIILTPSQAVLIAREKTNNAILTDFPDAEIFMRQETVEEHADSIVYSVKVGARANIGRLELVKG